MNQLCKYCCGTLRGAMSIERGCCGRPICLLKESQQEEQSDKLIGEIFSDKYELPIKRSKKKDKFRTQLAVDMQKAIIGNYEFYHNLIEMHSNLPKEKKIEISIHQSVAMSAVNHADALIEELNKTKI